MKRKIKILMKILCWIIRHIIIQTRNLNQNRDKYRENDDSRPVESTEIKLKWDF